MSGLTAIAAARSMDVQRGGFAPAAQTSTLMMLLLVLMQMLSRMMEHEKKFEGALGKLEQWERDRDAIRPLQCVNVNQVQGDGNVIININQPSAQIQAPEKAEDARPRQIREVRAIRATAGSHGSEPSIVDSAAKSALGAVAGPFLAPAAGILGLLFGNAHAELSGSASVGPVSGSFKAELGAR